MPERIWLSKVLMRTDSYQVIKRVAQQMQICNPELFYNHLHGIQRADESIDEVLAEAVYPYYDTNGYKISELLGLMLECIVLHQPDEFTLFTAQEIADVYCKNFELSDEVQSEYKSLYIVQDFNKNVKVN